MRISALLLAGLVALTLTGCQTDDPIVVPQPEPSSTPLFASEEEALAAAEEAYAGYLAASDAVLADGGANPERTYEYLTETMQLQQAESLKLYTDSGWHSTGTSSFDRFDLQQFLDYGADGAEVTAYACLDVSKARILDEAGADVTPSDRPDRLPVELAFVAEGSAEMKIDRSDLWSGDDFCD